MTLFERVRTRLLDPYELSTSDLARTLSEMATRHCDLGDIYLQSSTIRSLRLEDSRVSGGNFSQTEGFGLRGAKGAELAFAHSADLSLLALSEAAGTVRQLLLAGDALASIPAVEVASLAPDHGLYGRDGASDDLPPSEWLAMLHRIDVLARSADPRVVRVDATISYTDDTIMVLDLDGRLAVDVRPLLNVSLRVMIEANGRRTQGYTNLGRRHGLSELDEAQVRGAVATALRIADRNLEATASPVGTLPVVLAPGYPGVLFHEAVGHGLESDHHRKDISVFAGMMGERVAASGVTVVDDGSLTDRVGSVGVDDEGVVGQRTVLIEDGILVGLLHDRLNAGLMNARPTGNGRRQSYAHLPQPRMTNTFLENGALDPDEIVASIQYGLFIPGIGGGQVDITSGQFNFSTTEAYLIENGKVTASVDGATLTGAGHQALRHISMIGNDLKLDDGQAICTKGGQDVAVGVGQPTIRIDNMLVGGRSVA